MRNNISPQEKKIRDYLNQRTNSYGENDKSSRKAIRVRKASVNRSFRRAINNVLSVKNEDADVMENLINSTRRNQWKKYPDECLLKSFEHKWSDNSRIKYLNFEKKLLQSEAKKRLNKSNTRYYWY